MLAAYGRAELPGHQPTRTPPRWVRLAGAGGCAGWHARAAHVLVVQFESCGTLIADRLGTGTRRVYTLTYTGSDLAGNTASAQIQISVPHDLGTGQ
jgi:hypothetical protein